MSRYILISLCFFSYVALAEFGVSDSQNLSQIRQTMSQINNSIVNQNTDVNHILGYVDEVERLLSTLTTNNNVSVDVDLNIVTNIYTALRNLSGGITNIYNTINNLYADNYYSWGSQVTQSLHNASAQLSSIQQRAQSLTKLDTIDSNVDEISRHIDQTDNTISLISNYQDIITKYLGGGQYYVPSDIGYNNILTNLKAINSKSGLSTNDIAQIKSDLISLTNQVAQMLVFIATNRLDISDIGITNLIDYTDTLASIDSNIDMMQTQFEDFKNEYRDALTEDIAEPVSNELSIINITLNNYGDSISNRLDSIVSYITTNYLNNATLQYILNPTTYSRNSFTTPIYLYKGEGAPIRVVNQTLTPDLSGFANILNSFIPNNLASVNNYLYDMYLNGVKTKNFDAAFNVLTNQISEIIINLQTNQIDLTGLNITNLNDYTAVLDRIDNNLDMIQGQFELFTNEYFDNFENFILEPLTNNQERIISKLDSWDLFYSLFTNRYTYPLAPNTVNGKYAYKAFYGVETPSQFGKFHYDESIQRLENAPFADFVITNMINRQNMLASLNNYAAAMEYALATNKVFQKITSIDNYLQTNYFNNAALQYILNPSVYFTSQFVTPRYYYKGFDSPIQVNQQSLNPDLGGLQYIFNNFIPNNLASINNYLYDLYVNGLTIRDLDNLVITNFVNNTVDITNNLEVSVNTTNLIDTTAWGVILGWASNYVDLVHDETTQLSPLASQSTVWANFGDLDNTNVVEVEYIASKDNYLVDTMMLLSRQAELLASINKTLMRSAPSGDTDLSNNLMQEGQKLNALRDSIEASDFLPDVGGSIKDRLELPSLPRVNDNLPDTLVFEIPYYGHYSASENLMITIDVKKVETLLAMVRAFFRLFWYTVVALLIYWCFKYIWRLYRLILGFFAHIKIN